MTVIPAEQLEAAAHAAFSALQARQRPSGSFEFYGPRAAGMAEVSNLRTAEKTLLKERTLIALEHLGVVEHRSKLWFKVRRANGTRLHKYKGPLPTLQELLADALKEITP